MKSLQSAATVLLVFVVLLVVALPRTLFAVDYQVKLVATGLDQPNFMTQAPGETDSSIIYYTERAGPTLGNGFNATNPMGSVMRYDTSLAGTTDPVTNQTYIGTPVINLGTSYNYGSSVITGANRQVKNDDGLEGMTFSPNFQTDGLIFVSSSQFNSGSVPTNRVEEYKTTNPADPTWQNTTFVKTILQYNNNVNDNHTIDQIAFNPTATGEDKYDLYISTGNGSFGASYNGGVNNGTNVGMPSQNPADLKGKILRVDVNPALPSAYGTGLTDANGTVIKNFAIPASNPVVAYNAANPSTPLQGANTSGATAALPEVYVTGLRNTYRFSFDRTTGAMYLGDVGETYAEEVNTIPAGFNTGVGATVYNSHGPVDMGWPQNEGIATTNTKETGNDTGYPAGTVNPFTSATSLLPIQQYLHTSGNTSFTAGGSSAVIGGVMYQGPIASLKGTYFYADFAAGTIGELTAINTNPSTFNGTIGVGGDATFVNATSQLDALSPNGTFGHIVQFAEDNSGNMYIVDFGGTAGNTSFSTGTAGANGEYPAAGLGMIYELVAVPEPATATLLIPLTGVLLLVRQRSRKRTNLRTFV